MNVIVTSLPGLLIVEPTLHRDARGYFTETYSRRDWEAAGITAEFVQDNQSMSSYGVIRGLHFQRPPHAQAKLVRCVRGCVLDVAVDLRPGSATYGRWEAVELSEDNHRQLFIPRGFAHGFAVLSDVAVFQYKCDNYYAPEAEGGINPLDPTLAIDWRIPAGKAIFSEKDTKHPAFKQIKHPTLK